MLDSAHYNAATVTTTKSVPILAVPGAVGNDLATPGAGDQHHGPWLHGGATQPRDRSLGGRWGAYGISMAGASTLFVEHSLIANVPCDGVYVSGNGIAKVANSIIRNVGGYVVSLQNGAKGEISGTQMLGDVLGGVNLSSSTVTTTTASVSDSLVSGGQAGMIAQAMVSGATTKNFLSRSTISGTDSALYSETSGVCTAVVTMSGNTITNNFFGWYLSGAGSVIRSVGNNHITKSTWSTGVFTPTALQ